MNRNPVESWSPLRFWSVFALLLLLEIGAAAAIWFSDCDLKHTCTKKSAALEWVAWPDDARNIVDDWDENHAIPIVTRGVLLDFAFILFYSTWLAITIFRCGQAVPLVSWWSDIGDALAPWMWIAGALDVVENLGILLELHARAFDVAPTVALVAWCKWTIVAAGVLYILFTIVLWLRTRAAGDDFDLQNELRALSLDEHDRIGVGGVAMEG